MSVFRTTSNAVGAALEAQSAVGEIEVGGHRPRLRAGDPPRAPSTGGARLPGGGREHRGPGRAIGQGRRGAGVRCCPRDAGHRRLRLRPQQAIERPGDPARAVGPPVIRSLAGRQPIGDPAPAPRARRVRLNVADLERERAFYEQTIGLRRVGGEAEALRLGTDGYRPGRARRRPGGPGARPANHRPLPPGDPRPEQARAGARPAPRTRSGWSLDRGLRPPGQRGSLPERPGGQRDRALPGSAPSGLALRRRPARDVDPAARPRRSRRRGSTRRYDAREMVSRGRGSATCT